MKTTSQVTKQSIITVIVQFFYLLILILFFRNKLFPENISVRILVNLFLVLLPSILWCIFFYLQDRLEPEPIKMLIFAFYLGLSINAILANPLKMSVFKVMEWLDHSLVSQVLGILFNMALIDALLMFLLLRFVIYPAKEVDEPVDVMVYGSLMGIGYAAFNSFYLLFSHATLNVGYAAYYISLNALLYASIGAFQGYFFGRVKFFKVNRELYFIAGLVSTILILGGFLFLNQIIYLRTLYALVWSYLIVVFFVICIFAFVLSRIRRWVKVDMHKNVNKNFYQLEPILSLIMVLLIAASICNGVHFMNIKKFQDRRVGLEFICPNELQPGELPTQLSLFAFNRDNFFKKSFPTKYGEQNASLLFYVNDDSVSKIPLDYSQFLLSQKLTKPYQKTELNIDGKAGQRLEYAIDLKSTHSDWKPALLYIITDIFRHKNKIIIFNYFGSPTEFNLNIQSYKELLNSIKWR